MHQGFHSYAVARLPEEQQFPNYPQSWGTRPGAPATRPSATGRSGGKMRCASGSAAKSRSPMWGSSPGVSERCRPLHGEQVSYSERLALMLRPSASSWSTRRTANRMPLRHPAHGSDVHVYECIRRSETCYARRGRRRGGVLDDVRLYHAGAHGTGYGRRYSSCAHAFSRRTRCNWRRCCGRDEGGLAIRPRAERCLTARQACSIAFALKLCGHDERTRTLQGCHASTRHEKHRLYGYSASRLCVK